MEKITNVIGRIIGVATFNKKVYGEIAKKGSLGQALAVVALAGLLYSSGVVMLVFSGKQGAVPVLEGLLVNWVFLFWIVYAGLAYLLSRLLGGKAGYRSYLKVAGYSLFPMSLEALPPLGTLYVGNFAGFIWSVACYIYATREVQKLPLPKAMTAVLIPVLIGVAVLRYYGGGI